MSARKMFLVGMAAAVAVSLGVVKLAAAVDRDWTIKPGALGDIKLGAPLPLFVLGMSPDFYQGYYGDGIPFIGCDIPSRDISIRLEFFILVQGITPGPGYRTAENIGSGSTLDALRRSHGSVETSHIPEPVACVARTPDLPDVYFEFTTCDAAESGEGVANVNIWRRMN